jgi:hypothetical protein
MNTRRYPGAFGIALAALFAALFFLAGYSVKTANVASAAPRPTPTQRDGNPSGHYLVPPKTLAPPADEAQWLKAMKLVSVRPFAIRYVKAKPGGTPPIRPPTCAGNPLCVSFAWKNMTLSTRDPDNPYGWNGPETVDVYGTFASK